MEEETVESAHAYTLDEMAELCFEVEQFKLSGRSRLDRYTYAELCRLCNGIGAEWMPKIMRNLLTALSPFAEPAAVIHDVEYFEGGGEEDGIVVLPPLSEESGDAVSPEEGGAVPLDETSESGDAGEAGFSPLGRYGGGLAYELTPLELAAEAAENDAHRSPTSEEINREYEVAMFGRKKKQQQAQAQPFQPFLPLRLPVIFLPETSG